ncbi:hypothetical protein EJB05_13356, partial [Eragrostis curvula]
KLAETRTAAPTDLSSRRRTPTVPLDSAVPAPQRSIGEEEPQRPTLPVPPRNSRQPVAPPRPTHRPDWIGAPTRFRVVFPRFAAMGLFGRGFTFMMGMGCGVYVAQNYNVPNVKKLFNTYVFLAKHIEETYRKPKKNDDD